MTLHQYALIAVMAVVVIILRSVPFVLFSGKRKVPASLLYLGKVLTAAAIAMLVVYSLYGNLNYPTCGAKNLLPGSLVSIIAGTACYMLTIQTF